MIWPAVVVQLGYLGTGLVLVRLLARGDEVPVIRRVIVALLLGMTAQIGLLYLIVSFAPIPRWVPLILTLFGVAAAGEYAIAGARAGRGWVNSGVEGARALPQQPLKTALVVGLLVLMLVPVANLCQIGMRAPVSGSDGISIWASKSVGFYHGEHLHSEFFVDGDRVHAHRGYPVAFPLFQYQHLAIAGTHDDRVITAALMVALLLWLAAFIGLLGEWVSFPLAMAAGALVTYMPAWYDPISMGAALSGFADLPLGALACLGGGLVMAWLATGDRLALAGGAAAWSAVGCVKDEGTLWVMVVLGACAATLVFLGRRPTGFEVAFLSLPPVSLGVRWFFHRHLPSTSDLDVPDPGHLLDVAYLMPEIGGLIKGTLLDGQIVGLVPVVALVGFMMGIWRNLRNPLVVFAMISPVMWAAFLVVVALTGVQLDMLDYYSRVTYPRLVLQLAPVSLLFAVILNSPVMLRRIRRSGKSQ